MSSKTKILIFRAKELIYTGIFVFLGILLILLLIFMFFPRNNNDDSGSAKYVAGVYNSTVTIGDSWINIAVTVDNDTVSHVELVNADEAITTMYPLLEPALEEINSQISTVDSIDQITYSSENQYTTVVLTQSIKSALEKARVK